MLNRVFQKFYQLFNQLIPCDITGVWILDLSQIREPDNNAPDFEFRFLDAKEVIIFSSIPCTELKVEMAELISSNQAVCFAAIKDGNLAAFTWFAKGRIEPAQNSGGRRFTGIGLCMNKEYIYLFKAFVLPEFRGNALNGWIFCLAGRYFIKDGVRNIITTTDWSNDAFKNSATKGGFEYHGAAAEWILGGRHRYLLPRLRSDKPSFFSP